MTKGVKVTLKRSSWGSAVMASPEMQGYLRRLGERVAAQLPGGRVQINTAGVVGGGSRSRVWITSDVPLTEEAASGRALAALRSVVPSAHQSSLRSMAARKSRARKKVQRRAGRKIIAQRRNAKGS